MYDIPAEFGLWAPPLIAEEDTRLSLAAGGLMGFYLCKDHKMTPFTSHWLLLHSGSIM